MILEDFTKKQILNLLVETVHSMILYPHHKKYIHDLILGNENDLEPQLLSSRLNVTLGEVLVILKEIKEKNNSV